MKSLATLILVALLADGNLVAQGPEQAAPPRRISLLHPEREPAPVPKAPAPTPDEQALPPDRLAPLPVPQVPTLNPNPRPRPLMLEEVLLSVEQHYPLLAAAFQEQVIASGKALSAAGEFDTQLSGHLRYNQGSFDNQRYRLGITQPTAFQGITFGGGWRLGAGSYPVYYQDRQTGEGGEIYGGVTVPLLKDREIDARRGGLQQAALDQQLAEPLIGKQRIQFIRSASNAYWAWVAAASRLGIGKDLLRIAEQRDEYLRKQSKAGRIAEIEITDNRRTILDRRARLARLQQQFEQASFDLSLFARDERGVPLLLANLQLAPSLPEPNMPAARELIQGVEVALMNRPELVELRLQRDKINVRLALANNQTLPDLRFFANQATDVGNKKSSLDRYAYEAGLLLEVPLQRRQAQGRIRTARGEMAQVRAREAFLQESITAEVQKAISAILRAYEINERVREAARLAEVMERGEIRKLELGQSNILFVNLRELARADAQAQVVDAIAEFHRAVADYRAALGLSLSRKSPLAPEKAR